MKIEVECDYRLGQTLWDRHSRDEYYVDGIELTGSGDVYVRIRCRQTQYSATYQQAAVQEMFTTVDPDAKAFADWRGSKVFGLDPAITKACQQAWDAALAYARSKN